MEFEIALNSKLHSKIFVWLYKVIVDVVYVKKRLNLKKQKKK